MVAYIFYFKNIVFHLLKPLADSNNIPSSLIIDLNSSTSLLWISKLSSLSLLVVLNENFLIAPGSITTAAITFLISLFLKQIEPLINLLNKERGGKSSGKSSLKLFFLFAVISENSSVPKYPRKPLPYHPIFLKSLFILKGK